MKDTTEYLKKIKKKEKIIAVDKLIAVKDYDIVLVNNSSAFQGCLFVYDDKFAEYFNDDKGISLKCWLTTLANYKIPMKDKIIDKEDYSQVIHNIFQEDFNDCLFVFDEGFDNYFKHIRGQSVESYIRRILLMARPILLDNMEALKAFKAFKESFK